MSLEMSDNAAFNRPRVHLVGCDILDMFQGEVDPLADIFVTQRRTDRVCAGYPAAVRPSGLYERD
jgi:hypothetical protein